MLVLPDLMFCVWQSGGCQSVDGGLLSCIKLSVEILRLR